MAAPMRTCVGCRTTRPKTELLRIARVADDSVAPDAEARAPGRGAYVCRTVSCVDVALRTGALSRGLRTALAAQDLATLREAIEEAGSG